jgi:hypothetical protein
MTDRLFTRRNLIIGGVILAALILAPFANLIITELILEPAAYYLWGLRQIFKVIPQSAYWLFLIGCLSFLAFLFLVTDFFRSRPKKAAAGKTPGPVEILTNQLVRTQDSNYFKWLVANRLAKTALKILIRNNGEDENSYRGFSDLDWDPPPIVRKYLETGKNSSFMEYREGRRYFKSRKSTPFDIDINEVIEYLETENS